MKLRDDTINEISMNLNDIEPMMENRSVFEFPTELNIPSYTVYSYKLPDTKRTFFGEKHGDLEITFRDFVGPSILHRIFDGYSQISNKKNFEIYYVLLDPTGHPIRGFKFKVGKVKKIEYPNNLLFTCRLIFSVKSVEYVRLYQ